VTRRIPLGADKRRSTVRYFER